MRQDKFSKQKIALYLFGVLPVVWLALLIAPPLQDGLSGLIKNGGAVFARPFHIEWCEGSLKTALILLACYGLGLAIYLSSERNYRKRICKYQATLQQITVFVRLKLIRSKEI